MQQGCGLTTRPAQGAGIPRALGYGVRSEGGCVEVKLSLEWRVLGAPRRQEVVREAIASTLKKPRLSIAGTALIDPWL